LAITTRYPEGESATSNDPAGMVTLAAVTMPLVKSTAAIITTRS